MFHMDHQSGRLNPLTELILLVEKPVYKLKGDKIQKSTEVQELRFQTGSGGIKQLIAMLEQASQVADDCEGLSGVINNHIVMRKHEESTNEKDTEK